MRTLRTAALQQLGRSRTKLACRSTRRHSATGTPAQTLAFVRSDTQLLQASAFPIPLDFAFVVVPPHSMPMFAWEDLDFFWRENSVQRRLCSGASNPAWVAGLAFFLELAPACKAIDPGTTCLCPWTKPTDLG